LIFFKIKELYQTEKLQYPYKNGGYCIKMSVLTVL